MAADVVELSRHYSLGFFPSSPSSLLAASTLSSLSCPARPDKRVGRSCLLGITNVPGRQFASFKAQAAITETDKDQPKWWERNAGPNMVDIHSTQEFLSTLSQAGDKLVIVDFYGSWCASCKALFPKLCRTAAEHPEILFLKDADGQLESFSCSLAKFQKIKDAIQMHNTARCSIGPPRGVGDLDLESVPL